MATTLIRSSTGESAAGGALGVLPYPEDIQGLNLPLADGGDNPLPDAAGGGSATTPSSEPKKV